MTAVDTATVGRDRFSLQFGDVKRGSTGDLRHVTARLWAPGLDGILRVSAHYATAFDELAALFRELADGWPGWQGEHTYESLEHDLKITAVHDGHVRLTTCLQQTSIPSGWSASAVIRLDPGEEMTQAAADLAALLSAPTPGP